MGWLTDGYGKPSGQAIPTEERGSWLREKYSAAPASSEDGFQWGDRPKLLAEGAANTVKSLAGSMEALDRAIPEGARSVAQAIPILGPQMKAASAIREGAGEVGEYFDESMSEYARERKGAGWTSQRPGQARAMDAPLDTLQAQLIQQIPNIAASATPAGLAKTGLQRGLVLAATGASMNAGELATEAYNKVKALDNLQLLNFKPYAELYNKNKGDEAKTRAEFEDLMVNKQLPLAIASGALGGVIGIDRYLAKFGFKGGKGSLRGAAQGAAEEFIGESIQTAGTAAGGQMGEVDAGMKDKVDWNQFFKDVLEGGTVGALVGGTIGGAVSGKRSEPTGPNAPDAGQAAALAPETPPATPTPEAAETAPVPEAAPPAVNKTPASPKQTAPVPTTPDGEEIVDDLEPDAELPDQPTREPVGDIKAQVEDMKNPDTERQGVYLPKATLENLQTSGEAAGVLDGATLVYNIGGEGNVLVVADEEVKGDVLDLLEEGATPQQVIGLVTGSGDGKTAEDTAAVERVDTEGNVVQSTMVTPEEAPAVAEEIATPDTETVVTTPEESVAAREERAKQEEVSLDTNRGPRLEGPAILPDTTSQGYQEQQAREREAAAAADAMDRRSPVPVAEMGTSEKRSAVEAWERRMVREAKGENPSEIATRAAEIINSRKGGRNTLDNSAKKRVLKTLRAEWAASNPQEEVTPKVTPMNSPKIEAQAATQGDQDRYYDAASYLGSMGKINERVVTAKTPQGLKALKARLEELLFEASLLDSGPTPENTPLLAAADALNARLDSGEVTKQELEQWFRIEKNARTDAEEMGQRRAIPKQDEFVGLGSVGVDTTDVAVDEEGEIIPGAEKARVVQETSSGAASEGKSVQVDEDTKAKYLAMMEGMKGRPGKHFRSMAELVLGRPVNVTGEFTAKDALAKLNFNKMRMQGTANDVVSRRMLLALRDKFAEVAGDVSVVYMDPADLSELSGTTREVYGLYDSVSGLVFVNNTLAGAEHDITLLHEMSHAAFAKHLDSDAGDADRKRLQELWFWVVENHDNSLGGDQDFENAMSNVHEFLAEAHSNSKIQQYLAQMEIPADLAKKLGVDGAKKHSVWSSLLELIRNAFGLGKDVASAFDGVMAATNSMLMDMNGADYDAYMQSVMGKGRQLARMAPLKRDPNKITDINKFVLKVTANNQLAQRADRYFGGAANNPLRKVTDLIEKRATRRTELMKPGDELVRKLDGLERKFAGEQWESFTQTAHDATMANVHPDVPLTDPKNAHLGKDAAKGWQAKARHAELMAKYDALDPELKDAWQEAAKYFVDVQNEMSLYLIENIVEQALGNADKAFARRIHNGSAVEADYEVFRTNAAMKAIWEAQELKKIDGVYFPLIRRGDYVTRAQYDINKENVGSGLVIDEDTVQYIDPSGKGGNKAARDLARKFVEGTDLKHVQTTKVWVDQNDPTVRLDKEDVNAVPAYRVRLQTKHVEFHDTARAAEEARQALAAEGLQTLGVEPRQDSEGRSNANLQSNQMKALMELSKKSDGYKKMTAAQQAEMDRFLQESSVRLLGSTRAQSRRLPRRYVQGASRDLTAVTAEYNLTTAGYLSKLQIQPDIDKAMGEARDFIKANAADDSNMTNPRKQLLDEMDKRISAAEQVHIPDTRAQRVVSRILTLSFLDKLVSPAYHMINMMQTTVVTLPVVSGRHGVARTARAIEKAYRDLGVTKTLGAGLKDTAKTAKAEAGNLKRFVKSGGKEEAQLIQHGTNYLDLAKDSLRSAPDGADVIAMLDAVAESGGIDPHAGMEIDVLDRRSPAQAGNKLAALDTALGRTDNLVRQIGLSVESLNRLPAAIAAYRLEFARTKDKEAAIRYAKDTVNNTHFNYSQSNAAPVFQSRNPVARMALNFKKYSQGMMFLMIRNLHTAMSSGYTKQERLEAGRSLAYLFATHATVAGALGLPTEIPRAVVTVMFQLGLLEDDWEDIERWVEETIGEIPARGLPRLLGIDVSQRMGLQDLITMETPRGGKSEDWMAWIGKTGLGAPGALVSDWAGAAKEIAQSVDSYLEGNTDKGQDHLGKAFEQAIPLKVVADGLKAYRQATEGSVNKKGRVTSEPTDAYETFVQVLGFRPARLARDSAEVSRLYSDKRKRENDRRELFSEWKDADAAGKARLRKKLREFNKTVPSEARVTEAQLIRAARRDKKAERYRSKGVYVGKRDADLIRED